MVENVTPELVTPPISTANRAEAPNVSARLSPVNIREHRPQIRNITMQSSKNKDFEGLTPKIGGVLVLRSEHH